ncbi:hypothetical protein PS712_05796 [Pseudomonas fluorescens]|jgi:hypothetical protein|uniref:Uncharacterized protein n=1 Tax=Pseudomonas fluorescens TaxID=294 RepID=A0A5E7FQ08_PSEFL|nr:hypothetical protein PS712_05796 [Pseudomonas fluorescens]
MIEPKTLLILMILATWALYEVCRRLNDRQRRSRGDRK